MYTMKKQYDNCPALLVDLFGRSFPNGVYNNKSATFPFDKERTFVLRLTSPCLTDHYEGVTAIIYNKKTGEIARQYFPFDEHLSLSSTSNPDYTKTHSGFHIWKNNGYSFYINQPTETSLDAFCIAIDDWLAEWK